MATFQFGGIDNYIKQLNKLQTVASELNKQINDLAKQVA